jgi:hypothetical protein
MSRGLRGLGSSGPGSPSSQSSPPAQDASTSSGSETNASPLGFARTRQGGLGAPPENVLNTPNQPGTLPQFLNPLTTTSQTGANTNVSATRLRYGSGVVPQQSRSTTLDTSKYAGMNTAQIKERLEQLDLEKAKREQEFADSARIEREANEAKEQERRKKLSENNGMRGRTGVEHPSYGRTGPWSGITGPNHPRYGKISSESTRNKMSENAAMLGIIGENHPKYGTTGVWSGVTGEQHPRYGTTHTKDTKEQISRSHLLNELSQGGREMAELQGLDRDEVRYQVHMHRHIASQTQGSPQNPTTSSTSSAQNLPAEPITIPRQPTQESSATRSPPKQDNPDDSDIIDY